jgi:hypothetical protein
MGFFVRSLTIRFSWKTLKYKFSFDSGRTPLDWIERKKERERERGDVLLNEFIS